ncbi:MAG: hypothetical protein QW728_05520, partial [Thermoplasmata archaeon]
MTDNSFVGNGITPKPQTSQVSEKDTTSAHEEIEVLEPVAEPELTDAEGFKSSETEEAKEPADSGRTPTKKTIQNTVGPLTEAAACRDKIADTIDNKTADENKTYLSTISNALSISESTPIYDEYIGYDKYLSLRSGADKLFRDNAARTRNWLMAALIISYLGSIVFLFGRYMFNRQGYELIFAAFNTLLLVHTFVFFSAGILFAIYFSLLNRNPYYLSISRRNTPGTGTTRDYTGAGGGISGFSTLLSAASDAILQPLPLAGISISLLSILASATFLNNSPLNSLTCFLTIAGFYIFYSAIAFFRRDAGFETEEVKIKEGLTHGIATARASNETPSGENLKDVTLLPRHNNFSYNYSSFFIFGIYCLGIVLLLLIPVHETYGPFKTGFEKLPLSSLNMALLVSGVALIAAGAGLANRVENYSGIWILGNGAILLVSFHEFFGLSASGNYGQYDLTLVMTGLLSCFTSSVLFLRYMYYGGRINALSESILEHIEKICRKNMLPAGDVGDISGSEKKRVFSMLKTLFSVSKNAGFEGMEASVWNTAGRVYGAFGDYKRALECFTISQSIEPDNTDFILNRTAAAWLLGKVEDAVKIMDNAVRRLSPTFTSGSAPDTKEFLLAAAKLYFISGRYEKAYLIYDMLIPSMKKEIEMYNAGKEGKEKIEDKDVDNEFETLRKGLAQALSMKGLCLTVIGMEKKAQDEFKESLNNMPERADTYAEIASAYAIKGAYTTAYENIYIANMNLRLGSWWELPSLNRKLINKDTPEKEAKENRETDENREDKEKRGNEKKDEKEEDGKNEKKESISRYLVDLKVLQDVFTTYNASRVFSPDTKPKAEVMQETMGLNDRIQSIPDFPDMSRMPFYMRWTYRASLYLVR